MILPFKKQPCVHDPGGKGLHIGSSLLPRGMVEGGLVDIRLAGVSVGRSTAQPLLRPGTLFWPRPL